MANLKVDSSYGYEMIEDKMRMLLGDIEVMLDKKEISTEAAEYLLKRFSETAKICEEYKQLSEEKEEENNYKISF